MLGLSDELKGRLARFHETSAIEQRHSVIPNFVEQGLYAPPFPEKTPGTAARNALYRQEAPKLAEQVAVEALKRWGGQPRAITHVVVVSCTGMMAPGIEFLLLDRLGLSPDTERLGINFMGCFGALKGLAAARALCAENPDARVLLVCVELCTLHMQTTELMEVQIGNVLFGDGAAACVVGNEPGLAEIVRRGSRALPDSLSEMTWGVSDTGFVMQLTAEVPRRLRAEIASFSTELSAEGVPLEDHGWVVHPGGRAVLHGIAQACGLQRQHLDPSYEVLRKFGNMSSPTVLFVLEELLSRGQVPEWLLTLAFGPGLSMEGMLLKR